MLLNLPSELLLQIVHYIPSVQDKCRLLQTCTRLHQFLSTHSACWSNLDFSPYGFMSNSILLTFLKNRTVSLNSTATVAIHNSNYSNNKAITKLDLSGCSCLSEDLITALSKALPALTQLSLNGYRLNNNNMYQYRRNLTAFEQQRDHVYQIPPSHGLSYMAMSFSKKSPLCLKIPYVMLVHIVSKLSFLTHLSIQYQDISLPSVSNSPDTNKFAAFKHIRHLDISSCTIGQPELQSLIRTMSANLIGLKMLNINISNLTWLCLSQHGTNLKLLHISCNESLLLSGIEHVVTSLKELEDFRLTRVLSSRVGHVISSLDTSKLKRLDVSPKMHIYLKNVSPTYALHRDNTSTSRMTDYIRSISNYSTIEHDLQLTEQSVRHLAQCQSLVELRICFPTITPTRLTWLLKAVPQLEIFELRIPGKEKNSDDAQSIFKLAQRADKNNYLTGIKYLNNLKELFLFSVFLDQDTIETIAAHNSSSLKYLTISKGGSRIEIKENLQLILNSCKSLEKLCLGQITKPSIIHELAASSTGAINNSSDHSYFTLCKDNNKEWRIMQ